MCLLCVVTTQFLKCLVAAAWTAHTHHASASVHGHQHSQVHILPLLFLKLLAYALWGRVRACVLAHLIIIVKACMRDSHSAFNTYLPDPNHMYIQGCPIGTGS